jgi:hypothetical protein
VHGSFTELYAGTCLFRVRVHSETEDFTTAEQLGPPPPELARMANRMSPAGISMFYGALDQNTAVAETFDPNRAEGMAISIAEFRTAKPLVLLDLVVLPELPSQFDEESRHLRAPLIFLRDFVRDLTRPVERNGYEHVEYVPTQVVTEYVRYALRTPDDQSVDGLLYRSSRPSGDKSVVLFLDDMACGPRQVREVWHEEPVLILEAVRKCSPSDFQAVINNVVDREEEFPRRITTW